jgi:hypothetical protein
MVPFAVLPTLPEFPVEFAADRLNISVELDSCSWCNIEKDVTIAESPTVTTTLITQIDSVDFVFHSSSDITGYAWRAYLFQRGETTLYGTASLSIRNARISFIVRYSIMYINLWKKSFSFNWNLILSWIKYEFIVNMGIRNIIVIRP